MSLRLIILALLLLIVAPAHAQESPQARFESARDAWDKGHFIESMEVLEDLLRGGPDPQLEDRIALLTGELFSVRELATDGRAVRWSPDGQYGAYESGSGSESVTHILGVGSGGVRDVATVSGAGVVFAPTGGRIAYLAVDETPAYREALARLEEEFSGTDRAARMGLRSGLAQLNAEHTLAVVQDLTSGQERRFQPPGIAVSGLLFGPENSLHFVGSEGGDQQGDQRGAQGEAQREAQRGTQGGSDIFRAGEDGTATKLTEGPGQKTDPSFALGGSYLIYGTGRGSFAVMNLGTRTVEDFQGSYPVAAGDGRTLAYLSGSGAEGTLNVLTLTPGAVNQTYSGDIGYPVSTSSTRACSSCPVQSGLSLSTDGSFAVVQARPREDWELFRVPTSGSEGAGEISQVTREIQHDLYPTLLADGRLLAMKGEGRHRRSHLYDLETGEETWLFRNNTVRTVAPEYEWAPSPDGSKLLIVAERDGNTVSPERGVYLMDLGRKVTREELLARVRTNLEAERQLRAKAETMYEPIASEVQEVVDRISTARLFEYQKALFLFGSKNVSQPGNRSAIDYIAEKLREFGFEPEFQWFEARGVETANVIARIPGTTSPDVVYAVSAHFDSNARSPGADDNTSATVGLMEMARVLADHPMPATIEIALFTGEESGLLGSREYVRRSVESGKKLVGALNNDMVGFAEDHRLDNTIRYSNAGIRDVQHGGAILFSEMVSHDAEYYKSTDAAAYYDAYGDIVGGIGSYPILASPHYHQSHDVLETINHKLVTEVAKMSAASVMLLASSPSRIKDLEASDAGGEGLQVSWTPSVESDIAGYLVAYGPEEDPLETVVRVEEPRIVLEGTPAIVSVRAVNRKGMEGWDWAQIRLGG